MLLLYESIALAHKSIITFLNLPTQQLFFFKQIILSELKEYQNCSMQQRSRQCSWWVQDKSLLTKSMIISLLGGFLSGEGGVAFVHIAFVLFSPLVLVLKTCLYCSYCTKLYLKVWTRDTFGKLFEQWRHYFGELSRLYHI